MEADDGRCFEVLAKVFEVGGAQVDFRSNLAGKGDACITVMASERPCDALADLLLARTPTNVDFEIVDGADGHGMTFCLNASILPDRGNHSATLTALTEGQGLWVARVRKSCVVAWRMIVP
jgi:hypothetical protein